MDARYRILHVEDTPDDAELVLLALRRSAYAAGVTRVDSERDFSAYLAEGAPDVILCDYHLPAFSAERALSILRERHLDVPFIVVSHHIGENAAVIAMQQGATDYLSKADLERLPKAIASAIEGRDARRERQRALEALRRSEAMRRGILDALLTRLALLDGTGTVLAINRAWEEFDTSRTALTSPTPKVGVNYLDVLREASGRGQRFAKDLARGIQAVSAREKPSFSIEYQLEVDAVPHWYWARVKPMPGTDSGVVVSHLDITDRVVAHLALQDAQRRLQALSARILAIQEAERRAISLELHDDVGQTLGALKIGLHRLARTVGEGQAGIVSECFQAANAALEKLRRLSHDLRPPQLDQLGLEEALRWLVERQHAVTGLEIRFRGAEISRRFGATVESACYRIAQEALNNAARHAKAKLVQVGLESDGHLLKLSVHDDGVGFDDAAARERTLRGDSLGLIGMEERAQLAGGRVKVRSVAGAGTTVSAVFPVNLDVPVTAGAGEPA